MGSCIEQGCVCGCTANDTAVKSAACGAGADKPGIPHRNPQISLPPLFSPLLT